MAASNDTDPTALSSDQDPNLYLALVVISGTTLTASVVAIVSKAVFRFAIPIAWKLGLLFHDISTFFLSLGLVLIASKVNGLDNTACTVGGFFLLFGVFDFAFSTCLLGLTFMIIQSPDKISQLSTVRWGLFFGIVVPEKVVSALLCAVPTLPISYFHTESVYPVMCLPIRQEGKSGATFGAILVFITWTILAVSLILCVVNAVRLWKISSTRIHASTPSLWQIQKMEQARSIHRYSIVDLFVIVVVMFIVTIIVYTNTSFLHSPQWIALLSLSVLAAVHVIVSTIQFFLWTSLCCEKKAQEKEPYHRLKQLELVKNEGPGKVLMKASWSVGKGMWKRGLLKVYGPAHIKSWAQEIVVLGLMRKSQSASVLQCLWTSNSNPYFETMTLISGQIVSSDSRLTCLELTSNGTLLNLLKNLDVPLPEPCQRTIMHDIAEGLSCLHDQNVLHKNLTSAAVYVKGSIKCFVLRASIGDFEEAKIYGTLLTGAPNSTASKRQFFYPDIRAFGLVGIEMLAKISECKQKEKQSCHRSNMKSVSTFKDSWTQSKMHGYHSKRHDKRHDIKTDRLDVKQNMTSPRHVVKPFVIEETSFTAPGEAEYLDKFPENQIFTTEHTDYTEQVLRPQQEIHPQNKTQLHFNSALDISSNQFVTNVVNSSNHQNETHFEDRYNHSQAQGISNNKLPATNFEKDNEVSFRFPNNSVFRPNCSEEDELEIIEEEIDRSQESFCHAKTRSLKHGGYVMSHTEDGREIFIPATHSLKKSKVNSSSGYGSHSSTPVQSDYYTSGGSISNHLSNKASINNNIHKTISSTTISSFEDDGLQVLPGMADVDDKNRKGEKYLRELMKAKQDAKVEQLIESYEERVRKGELGANLEGIPIGVVFPKINRQFPTQSTTNTVLANNVGDVRKDDEYNDEVNTSTNNMQRNSNCEQHPARAKTAGPRGHTKLVRSTSRPASAGVSSLNGWNARSSVKRNRARTALRKALHTQNQGNVPRISTSRDAKAREIELKYSNRQGTAKSERKEINNNMLDSTNSYFKAANLQNTNSTQINSCNIKQDNTNLRITQVEEPTEINTSFNINTNENIQRKQNVIDHKTTSSFVTQGKEKKPDILPKPVIVSRKPSSKSRPAPLPPNANQVNKNSESKQSSKYYTFNVNKTIVQPNREQLVSDHFRDVELASSSTSTTASETAPLNKVSNMEKIKSEMENIVESCSAQREENEIMLPPGVRLIETEIDTDSMTSEESCLCAAAALRAVEDGSSECPSEIFTQGSCSCACSNCIESDSPKNNGNLSTTYESSSWSNSNSFSSYDANMHRRMLPKSNKDSAAHVLGPDEQYPSQGHSGRKSKTGLYTNYVYSPKRNRRNLHPLKGHQSSSASDTSSAASRRYRELVKKGVPLQVSVVPGLSENAESNSIHKPLETHTDRTQNLYNELENNGFFDKSKDSNTSFKIHKLNEDFEEEEEDHYQEISNIPSLEEIIKEIPDETGKYSEESSAFLNRPESELSIKALQAVLSRHDSASETKSAEMIIDKLFTQQRSLRDSGAGMDFQSCLDLDETVLQELAMLPGSTSDEPGVSDIAGLLQGMDGRHVRYCHNICSRANLVHLGDLLPAREETFDILRTRLQHAGSLGVIGNQLLDIISTCWLQEVPPTSQALVKDLTDRVTETEL